MRNVAVIRDLTLVKKCEEEPIGGFQFLHLAVFIETVHDLIYAEAYKEDRTEYRNENVADKELSLNI